MLDDQQTAESDHNSGPRATHRRRRDVLLNAAYLFGTSIVTSVAGVGFWLVAARVWTQSAVGAGGALIAALQLLSTFCMLGLGTLMVGELSKDGPEGPSLLSTALLASGSAGTIVGLAFAVVVGMTTRAASAPRTVFGVALFAAAVGVTSALLVFDNAAIGLNRPRWQLMRNIVFSLVKFAAVPILALAALSGGIAAVAAWTAGAALSCLALVVSDRRALRRSFGRPRLSLVRHHGLSALTHHWLNVSSGAPQLLMPVLVASFLGARANAGFYAAVLLVSPVYMIPSHLSTSLFAVGHQDRAALHESLRPALRILLAVSACSLVGFAVLAHPLLLLFGRGYANASEILRFLGAATIATGVKSLYIAVSRVHGDLTRSALVCMIGSVAEAIAPLATLAAGGGRVDATAAWVTVMFIEALALAPALAAARADRPILRVVARWAAPTLFRLLEDQAEPPAGVSATTGQSENEGRRLSGS